MVRGRVIGGNSTPLPTPSAVSRVVSAPSRHGLGRLLDCLLLQFRSAGFRMVQHRCPRLLPDHRFAGQSVPRVYTPNPTHKRMRHFTLQEVHRSREHIAIGSRWEAWLPSCVLPYWENLLAFFDLHKIIEVAAHLCDNLVTLPWPTHLAGVRWAGVRGARARRRGVGVCPEVQHRSLAVRRHSVES